MTVTNADGCSGTSNPVTISEATPPTPVITVNGATELCEGRSVTLDAGAGYVHYLWSDGTTGRYLTTTNSRRIFSVTWWIPMAAPEYHRARRLLSNPTHSR